MKSATFQVPRGVTRFLETPAIRDEEPEVVVEQEHRTVREVVGKRAVFLSASLKITDLRLNRVDEARHTREHQQEQKQAREDSDRLKSGEFAGLMNHDRRGTDESRNGEPRDPGARQRSARCAYRVLQLAHRGVEGGNGDEHAAKKPERIDLASDVVAAAKGA